MTSLGIEFDSVVETLTAPPTKLLKIRELLLSWSATQREVQLLVGSLNVLAARAHPGRLFLSRLLQLLHGMPDDSEVTLDGEFQQDINWWSIHKLFTMGFP